MNRRPAFWVAMLATATASLCNASAGGPPPLIVLQDKQPWFQGQYGAYASPWSVQFDKALRRGTDYADTITIDPARFPSNTLIQTRWPSTKPVKGVWGYHALSFGNYDGGNPPVRVLPRRVRDIRTLRQTFAFRHSGSANFNLLTEFYLTSLPGDATAKLIEIGILLHAPASSMDFVRRGERIATFDDGAGRIWLITRTGSYLTIAQDNGADLPKGELDLKPILALLVRNGVITGNEWFNGIAFGTEPTEGGGTTRLRIDRWRVAYD